MLWLRREPNGDHRELGKTWWEWSRFQRERFRTPMSVAFAFVATHNHFVLDRGGKAFKQTAPVIKLSNGSTEDDHLALLGYLNSSSACFWMKQVIQPKGATAVNRNHPDPVRFGHEFSGTALEKLPIPALDKARTDLIALARSATDAMEQRAKVLAEAWWSSSLPSVDELKQRIAARWIEADRLKRVALLAQEEIDWRIYRLFGLYDGPNIAVAQLSQGLSRGDRPFEKVKGRRSFVRKEGEILSWQDSDIDGSAPSPSSDLAAVLAARKDAIRNSPELMLIEDYLYKRLWRDTEQNLREADFRAAHDSAQLEGWLATKLEAAASAETTPVTLRGLLDRILKQPECAVVAETAAEYVGVEQASILRAREWGSPSISLDAV
jgi:hypothetical protein